MPTTIYTDATLAAFAIGARTDATGAAVDDVSVEEIRLANEILTPGIVEPANGWLVAERGAGANMSVDVGSGVAKSDLAVVQGNVAGQGRYLVRKELATVNVTVPAADLSQARTDEVYLHVADASYDSGTLALPRIGYRKGDAGGGAPGPDAGWDAYLLLATIAVAANETAIETAHITDERPASAIEPGLVDSASLDNGSITTAKLADLAVTTAKIADGNVTTAKLPNGAVQVDKLANQGAFLVENFEVDGSVEVAGPVELTTGLASVATVNLTIPASWASWKCEAYATFSFVSAINAIGTVNAVIRIDGSDQQVLVGLGSISNADTRAGAVGGRRTGMTTTGVRSISLRAAEGAAGAVINDIYLYARAVRTS